MATAETHTAIYNDPDSTEPTVTFLIPPNVDSIQIPGEPQVQVPAGTRKVQTNKRAIIDGLARAGYTKA